ncbi:MAG TPA: BlaI/MecI/CopY family transcriptional regulator [Chitinophagaceae bacterium]|nr:BlaI/MecI/CopY family transcriptional regulator [Chitinophagaceae bacterium]
MQKLTKLEEEIMLIVWAREHAFVKDILNAMPEPRPHYNTVSTIIKILHTKGFIGFEAFGKSYRYFPLISQDDYLKQSMNPILSNYFKGSAQSLLNFFVREQNISVQELEQFIEELKQKK